MWSSGSLSRDLKMLFSNLSTRRYGGLLIEHPQMWGRTNLSIVFAELAPESLVLSHGRQEIEPRSSCVR